MCLYLYRLISECKGRDLIQITNHSKNFLLKLYCYEKNTDQKHKRFSSSWWKFSSVEARKRNGWIANYWKCFFSAWRWCHCWIWYYGRVGRHCWLERFRNHWCWR